MSDLTLWHNPRCSKSRQALALLQGRGVEPAVKLYLDTPPDRAQLDRLLDKLGISAVELLRTGQAEWKDSGLTKDAPEDQLRDLIVANPILIERPILETAAKAVIGRPPELILDLI